MAERKFKVGDRALHVNNQLDSREVVAVGEIDGQEVIDLQIGSLRTGPVPASNYCCVPSGVGVCDVH